MSIETDDQSVVSRLGGGTPVRKRLEVVRAAVDAGLNVQIVVSPCLPYTPDFADALLKSGAQRLVVDDFVAGDGAKGARTAASPFAAISGYDWRDNSHARALHDLLKSAGVDVSYSATGFCGIAPRRQVETIQTALPL